MNAPLLDKIASVRAELSVLEDQVIRWINGEKRTDTVAVHFAGNAIKQHIDHLLSIVPKQNDIPPGVPIQEVKPNELPPATMEDDDDLPPPFPQLTDAPRPGMTAPTTPPQPSVGIVPPAKPPTPSKT